MLHCPHRRAEGRTRPVCLTEDIDTANEGSVGLPRRHYQPVDPFAEEPVEIVPSRRPGYFVLSDLVRDLVPHLFHATQKPAELNTGGYPFAAKQLLGELGNIAPSWLVLINRSVKQPH